VLENDKQVYYKYNGYEYERINECNPLDGFFEFVNNEEAFVTEIYELFKKHKIANGIFGVDNYE